MDTQGRRERLDSDFATLVAVRADSTIFDFAPATEVATIYVLRFAGRGLGPVDGFGRPSLVANHEVEVRLPLDYPEQPPDIRWLTPLLHPNLSCGGVIQLDQLQLAWCSDMGLEVVCERLWDVARGAFFDLAATTNESARPWYEAATPIALPLDDRPLRARVERASNIVRYLRAGEQWNWPVAEEIFFIGDENSPSPLSMQKQAGRMSDEDVLYIGPE
jgi:hypothetical protein